MAELNVAQLKRRRAEMRVSINRIMFNGSELDEIIAALEDCDRLRATSELQALAITKLQIQIDHMQAEVDQAANEIEELHKDRERLRAAAQKVTTAWDTSAAIAELEAALESRDG